MLNLFRSQKVDTAVSLSNKIGEQVSSGEPPIATAAKTVSLLTSAPINKGLPMWFFPIRALEDQVFIMLLGRLFTTGH